MKTKSFILLATFIFLSFLSSQNTLSGQEKLTINDLDYFEMPGFDVMVFDDYYPGGHQSGVTILQNGVRVAANGDIRIGLTPPARAQKKVDKASGTIEAEINYPDISFKYIVKVKSAGNKIIVTADLSSPLPADLSGKAWFNLELFPAVLFGKSWSMDEQTGFFPTDSYGPLSGPDLLPYAVGKVLTVAPEDDSRRLTIKSMKGDLQLGDGRISSKSGWFVVRTAIPSGQTKNVIEWEIEANTVKDFVYKPVIHISQVGYLPGEPKKAVIEFDKKSSVSGNADILKINSDGTRTNVFTESPVFWGKFLKYNYAICDFTNLKEPGIYIIKYGDVTSNLFKIGSDVYDRYVWQPTLEYYLPVQMCHMRIEQGSRVWHDYCHLDDAIMAPTNLTHFDGYSQGPETFTTFKYPDHVPNLDRGGWHDAGDYDLRIESQAVTTWRLAMMAELFGCDLDATTVDQEKRIVTIHKSDGISDVLQQVEHGVLTILGGYKGLGRLYDGMISPTRKQYGLQGDASSQTDNLIYSRDLPEGAKTAYQSSVMDDNWVFTEDHPGHEMIGAATLASASRVLKKWKPEMSAECLAAAEDIYSTAAKKKMVGERIAAAAELFITTGDNKYITDIVSQKEYILANMSRTAWAVGMVYDKITDPVFHKDMDKAVKDFAVKQDKEAASTPFGVPYKPNVWGDGWSIQSSGVQYYFLVTGFPGVFKPDRIFSTVQFVLGCHPGENTASFASGVGVKSPTAAYGVNRADLSYIPGGVVSGTAIIRPDFTELKDDWSFLWQQTEYVMGGGATNFMFLVLATNKLIGK
ncbi:MAG TPA: glycoside hydrolase family 9 protein [Bacteroidales bacterium]|nr:glycoside hydrolase family 9 protein [Bacteroidales bacterium]